MQFVHTFAQRTPIDSLKKKTLRCSYGHKAHLHKLRNENTHTLFILEVSLAPTMHVPRCLLTLKESCKTYTIESTGSETDFALHGFPFSSHSSSPKVILGCQGYLQEKIKKQDLVPL